MEKTFFNTLIVVCSLSLTIFLFDCTIENNAFGAENEMFQIPEKYLSQTPEWEKCEFDETKKRWRKAECAEITVPLHWDNPEGDTITIYVKRLRALLKATKQMWWLEGGPGYAGTTQLPGSMQEIARLDWKTDLYTLDHRGTGYSNRLGCPEQETDNSERGIWITPSEGDACIEHLEANYNLDAFTVTQAAKDVGFLVELLKEEEKEIFVYGRSYGAYWGHRFAQIFSNQADGIILDGIVPSVIKFEQSEILGNDVAEDLLNICKEDDFCKSKMGNDPWGKANDILKKFQDGHCPELVENELTPYIFQRLAFNMQYSWDLRILLPVIYYRIDRCSEEDVSAFKHFWNFLLSMHPLTSRNYSDALFYHIVLSELLSDDPMPSDVMKEIDASLLITGHLTADYVLPLWEMGWPTYETDEYHHNWAPKNVPILMIHGTLDHRIPINSTSIVRENLNGSNQYFIEVPNAPHQVMSESPVKNIFATSCGVQVVLDYMEDPLAKPDTSCFDNIKSIDFRGNPLLALVLFGTWNLWE